LTLGIACCLLIYLYLTHEHSYDHFRPKLTDLYQVYDIDYLEEAGDNPTIESIKAATPELSAYLPIPLGPAMEEEIPEVVAHSPFSKSGGIFKIGTETFQQSVHLVSPAFIEMLDVEILAGDHTDLLVNKDQIILTESVARKFFKEADPIGQRISIKLGSLNVEVEVQAVVKDQPTHTNFPFEALTFEGSRLWYDKNRVSWGSYSTPTIVQLSPDAKPQLVEEKLLDLIERKKAESFKDTREEFDLPENLPLATFGLTPLAELHTNHKRDWPDSIDVTYSYIMAGIALLILLIACINYITLSLAQLSGRMREVGVRKVLGAHRRHVVMQFWGEAQVLALVAMVLSLGLTELSLPLLKYLSGREIVISYEMHGKGLWILLGITLLVGLLAGGYPAVYVSKFQPVKVLKGGRFQRSKGRFSQVLAVLQYGLTLFLIISSVVMFRQMQFISEMDLGYNHEQMIVVPTKTGWSDAGDELLEKMKGRLEVHPEVESVCGVSTAFSRGWSRYAFGMEEQEISAYAFRVDPGYARTCGLNILAGRDFSHNLVSDSSSIIINQKMVESLKEKLGWEEVLGQNVPFFDTKAKSTVIGIMADYHFRSLNHKVEPALLHMNPRAGKINYLYMKVNPAKQGEALTSIRNAWKDINPETPFDYTFLDEDLANQYKDYRRRMRIVGIATLIAICIACLGLFGMASLTTVSRTKEIGIRKVLGANIRELLVLLNRETLVMALLAFVIAAPISYWVMNNWLDDFAYQVRPDVWLFIGCLSIAILLALATVSYQVLRTARTSPVHALRYE
ncbi:MAG: FtsX-like permease family protein, partial [Bacteroidota bacterium]